MNKRVYLFIIFLLTFSNFLNADDTYVYGKRTLEIKREISQFFPRRENSHQEKQLFNYLENYFNDLELDFSEMNYSLSEQGHSFSKGYSLKIKGTIDDVLIIAVPLNNSNRQNSIRDGSINIAIALQLLEIFNDYQPPVTIEFLFLGAERGNEKQYPIGSRYYLSNFAGTTSTVVLYLDLDDVGDKIIFKNSSDNDLSPKWLVESFTKLLMHKELDFSTSSIQSLAYQSGFEKASPILNTYLDKEVPALLFESQMINDQTLIDDQWINAFIESILSFVLDNNQGFDKEWDRHYFISEFGGFLLSIGEKEGIIIMVLIIAFLNLIVLYRSRNLHLNLKRFRKHFWTFPLLLFLTFMYLFLSTLIIEEISNIRDFPLLWQQYPLMFLIFKLCTTLFLYSGFIYLVRGISISPSHHFYTYSAFVSVFISMFTVLLFNINFAFFFLWSLFIVSIFMISKKEFVKRISIFLSPIPIVIIGYIIFTRPYLNISEFLLVSRITGNIFLTIIIMPTLMLILSLNYYHHRFHRHRKSFRNIFSVMFWGSMTFLVLYNLSNTTPYTIFNKQPVYIDEKIDLNEMSRSILLNSPSPMGDLELLLDDQKLMLNNVSRSAEITAPMISDLLSITEETSTFLDRMSLQYNIDAKGTPDTINIQLQTDKSLIIFDSNYPFEETADGKLINFNIGRNPEMPLILKLIIPRGSAPDIKLTINYSIFPYAFQLIGESLYTEKKLTIIKEIQWNL